MIHVLVSYSVGYTGWIQVYGERSIRQVKRDSPRVTKFYPERGAN